MSTSLLTVDIAGLVAALGHDIEANEAAARPAAQAGAQVFYDEVVANVAALKRWTGNLASSIYQAYSEDNSAQGLATYHVSWNARKAPHGHLLEWGFYQRYEISFDPTTKRFTTHKDRPLPTPRHVPGRAFVRGALARQEQAQQAMERVYLERLAQAGVIA